jgi:Kef-type K+ transport system membrane component KefB
MTQPHDLPLTLFIVFGAAKALEEVCERTGLPGVVGQIAAGIVVGPTALGWIAPNEFLHALSELGVMFLLFQVGLEVKASELMKVGGTATLTAVLGVIVPFVMGFGILALFGFPRIEAIFMGAAMVATSVGITARVLSEKGMLHLVASKIILAAAVIDDVIGLLVLALVSGMAKGGARYVELATTAALAIGFTLIAAKWGHQTLGRVVKRAETLRVAESQFAMALVLLFALSVLSVKAGVAAIVGAFLAGMAMSESVGRRVHDLAFGVSELLVPFFLAGIGLQLDLNVFRDSGTLMIAGLILAAAIVSKVIGCGLGSLSLGRADAIRVGCGMAPRGEVGMVVAQIGLSMGVITNKTYAVAVFMSVMTTVAAPVMLNWAYRGAPAAVKGPTE